MKNGWHHMPFRSPVAGEFVCDHAVRQTTSTLQQLLEEPLGGVLVFPFLHRNIDDITVSVNGTPQVTTLTANDDVDFVNDGHP
jgi:hypothetical protein